MSLVMMRKAMFIRVVLIGVAIALLYIILSSLNLLPGRGGCLTSDLTKINTAEGFIFDVVDTNCDGLAKDDLISVLAAAPGGGPAVVIFKYDPARDSKLPEVKVVEKSGKKVISISIDLISSVVEQQFVWHGMPINYNIGRVEFHGEK